MNNFCLHPVGLLSKSTSVRGLGRRCRKRLRDDGQHSNFDFDRPALERVNPPSSGFPTRAVSPFRQSLFEAHRCTRFVRPFPGAEKSGETPELRALDGVEHCDEGSPPSHRCKPNPHRMVEDGNSGNRGLQRLLVTSGNTEGKVSMGI